MKDKNMISDFSELLQSLNKEFGFTEEQLKILERYTDDCINQSIAIINKKNPHRIHFGAPEKIFEQFELYCLTYPYGLKEDYKHPEVYWKLDVWYKFYVEDSKETFYFRDLDYLDVFLGKIRNNTEFIELSSGVILYTSAIAKIVFEVTQQKHNCANYKHFFVQVVEKTNEKN